MTRQSLSVHLWEFTFLTQKSRGPRTCRSPRQKKRYVGFWFLVRLVFGQARHQFLADVEDAAFYGANRDA